MNRSTIIYLGEPKAGNGRSVAQMLKIMEDSDNPLWWYQYVRRAIDLEKASGNVGPLDKASEIIEEMNRILDRMPNMKSVSVSSPNNQQKGLVMPEVLENIIFKKNVDLKHVWKWISDHFLSCHRYSYDWFALLAFLSGNDMLDEGNETTNAKFSEQMSQWFPSHNITAANVKVYRTGYLGTVCYRIWKKEEFLEQKRRNQKIEGFIHLHGICNVYLQEALENDRL